MRLAFIHPFLFRYPRGIERFLVQLVNALAHAGVDVDVLTWRWPDPVTLDALDRRVRVKILPTSRYFAARCIVPLYAYYLLKERYDFVWIFFAGYGEAESLALASALREIRYGVTLHYPYAQVPHRYHEFRRLGCIRRARRVVSTSGFVADGVRQAFGLDSSIIGTGVDAARFCPLPEEKGHFRRDLGLQADDLVLLSVAALESRKGMQHVLKALPSLCAEYPRLQYLVVGDGPFRRELEEQARELGVDHTVKLVGSTTNVLPYYQAADVFVLLSQGEAAPIAPLEAMAMELPVVVARQRPFDEMVTDECGVMVLEQEPAEVARVIGSFLSNSSLRQAAGKAGRRRVCESFTWERIAHRYLESSC
jgi:glycosyltransferase involved in cell wall biosynthesis